MNGPRIRKAWVAGVTLGMFVMAAPHAARGVNWLPAPSGCNQAPSGTGTFTMIGDAAGTANCACAVLLAPSQTLKMNNHTITCTGTGTTGVCITGFHEMLKGPGVIQGCTTAGASIGVASTGALVQNVQLMGNGTGVTDAASPNPSKILGNFVIANSNAGIESSAAVAVVAANHVTMNPVGVSITAGTALVENNYVLSNTGPGISVSSSAAGTVVQKNYVLANSGDGIDVTATGVGTLVTANQVNWNTGNGIDLASGATACRMIKNIARLNTGGDDLFDGNLGCAGNTWIADLFGISNQACVL